MTTLEQFVSPALMRALGWTLLHSLWQGALVAGVLAGVLLLLRRQRAEVRYVASAAALGMVVALAGITFGLYLNSGPAQSLLPHSGTPVSQPAGISKQAGTTVIAATDAEAAKRETTAHATSALPRPASAAAWASTKAPALAAGPGSLVRSITQSLIHSLNSHLPLLVLAWLLGLLAMSLRMLGGLLYVQRLRRYRVRPLPAEWQARLAALAARSGLKRPVALLESALVRVPLVVGHLRPVILLPLGTVAGLSGAQLEAILAHELAHVLRRDYLVNLLQTVAEVLFFYHPAVWFVAGCVRTERENCCDDTATALVGGDPLRLARALTALAEWAQSAVVPTAPRLALAAVGTRGELLNRVRRLVTRRPAPPTLAEGMMAGALVLGGLVLLGGSVALAGPLAEATTLKAARLVRNNLKSAATPSRPAVEVSPAPVEPDGVHYLTLLPGGRARASINGITAEFDTLLNPVIMQRSRRQGGPGTVVITRDKKGRLTSLLVNGQPVPVPTEKPTKEERRAGQQVTVLPMPATGPGDRNRTMTYNIDRNASQPEPNPKTARELAKAQREFEKASRKLNKLGDEMARAADKLDHKSEGTYVYSESRRSPNGNSNIHIDIDDSALNQLVTNALKLGNVGLSIGLQAANQGLEEARRSLEETLRDPSLSTEARRTTREALAELRQEQGRQRSTQEVRERQQEVVDRQQEARDRQQEVLDRQQEARDRAQEARDRQQELRERNRERNDALVDQMLKEGLIKDANHYEIKLTSSRLVIDGKEQSQKVFQKYLKRYESTSGRKLTGNNAMVITRNSDSSTIIDMNPPRPPRPPRAPLAPLPAPPALAAPPAPLAPPAPPAPPRLDTEALREELRKDGVIGAADEGFQMQLNNSGLTVNGKKQPDELANKYRKLTGHEGSKQFNIMISSQE